MTSESMNKMDDHNATCALCGKKFRLQDNQLKAWWAETWCKIGSGHLCPVCNNAAVKADATFTNNPKDVYLGILPFKSDIAKLSTEVPPEASAELRSSESWRHWVEQEHPERL